MSSSFTDQPSPRDRRHEEGYTPTPPTPAHEEDDVDAVRPRPKLGSLAQKARSQKLKQARIVLFLAGVLLIVMAVSDFILFRNEFQKMVDKEVLQQGGPGLAQIDRAALKQVEDHAFAIVCAIDGVPDGLGRPSYHSRASNAL